MKHLCMNVLNYMHGTFCCPPVEMLGTLRSKLKGRKPQCKGFSVCDLFLHMKRNRLFDNHWQMDPHGAYNTIGRPP